MRLDRPGLKRTLQLALSAAICYALYRAADWRAVADAVGRLDGFLLAVGLAAFVPQTLVSAWRWRRMIADVAPLPLVDSLRHTLAASALNLVVPSKLGDFSKAAFVPVDAGGERKRLAALVAVEKGTDLAMLLLVMLVGTQVGWFGISGGIIVLVCGWYLLNSKATATRSGTPVHAAAAPWRATLRPASPLAFVAATGVLWTLHLTQIHCFLRAAGVPSTWAMTTARVPAALLAGIVPAAFCGIGTRDAALVQLYADVAPTATMLAVGLLTSLRYVVPGAIGIPLLIALRRSSRAEPRPDERSTNRPPRPRPVATSATR